MDFSIHLFLKMNVNMSYKNKKRVLEENLGFSFYSLNLFQFEYSFNFILQFNYVSFKKWYNIQPFITII